MKRRGVTLEIVIEAAVKLIDEEGLSALTMATLAKKCEVQPPSLYNHVKGLEGLRAILREFGLKELYHALTEAVVGRAGKTAVFELSRAYLNFAHDHPGLYQLTIEAPGEGELENQRLGQSIVYLSQRVLEAFNLDEESSIHVVRGLRSLLHGFATLDHQEAFKKSVNLHESIFYNLNLYITGLNRKGEQI